MHTPLSPTYRDAFARYLRKGTALSLKADARTTTHYIWRTRDDDHVRTSHAANNGKLFAWSAPPATGHPGAGYNCRCVAEPYTGRVPPQLLQAARNALLDYLATTRPWRNFEMSLYFFIGNGDAVALESIGHASLIRDYYTRHYLPRFEAQIQTNAAHAPTGKFEDAFYQTYDFQGALYSYRNAAIRGEFTGEVVETADGIRTVEGTMYFQFQDQFKDPISIAQGYVLFRNFIPYFRNVTEEELEQWFLDLANVWQQPYPIHAEWHLPYQFIVDGNSIPSR